MASKKKEELLQPDVQTQAQPAAQSTYSTEGLDSRAEVEKAMANASYRPSQQVTDAANALKQWQQNRPAGQDQRAAGAAAGTREFSVQLHPRPALSPVRAAVYSERPQCQRGRGGAGGCSDRRLWFQLCHQCGAAGLSAADRRAGKRHPHLVQSGTGYLPERRRGTGEPAGPAERTGAERPDPV